MDIKTNLLYLENPYLREFDTEVLETNGNEIILKSTAFYIGGGGQPCDTGYIKFDGKESRVTSVKRDNAAHVLDGPVPEEGSQVHGIIDWERRYRIMRTHTAVHVLSGVAYQNFGVKITGNQLYEGRARLDLSFEKITRDLVQMILDESNKIIKKDLMVKWYYISRDEFKNRPELMRVDPRLYEKYEKIRVVEIENFDIQADGGTHVSHLSEIGNIVLEKYESKGKRNKRIYIRLEP